MNILLITELKIGGTKMAIIQNHETEGGWCLHRRINKHPKEIHRSFNCSACGTSFETTLDQNLDKLPIMIFIRSEYKPQHRFFGPSGIGRDIGELAVKYSAVCPSCGFSKELFCVSEDNIISGSWEDDSIY